MSERIVLDSPISSVARADQVQRSLVAESDNHLLRMCVLGEWAVVDTLLRSFNGSKDDLLLTDEHGFSPLQLATRENRLLIMERLLDLGADINQRSKDGRSAVHIAAAYGRDETMRLLLAKRADCLLVGGPKRQYPIHMACNRPTGALNIVQQLLKVPGKDWRLVRDQEGSVALFCAVDCGNLAVVKELLLVNTKAQVSYAKPKTGDTALHVACRRQNNDIATALVESGANFDAQNLDGHSPLHIVASVGDERLLRSFWSWHASANLVDRLDRTPLHIAAEKGHTTIVEILVDKFRSNVLARTKDGSTLMHIASKFGHPDTAQALLRRGVPLHMPNKSGEVSLHAAARKGHVHVVRSLLNKGAHVDQKTKDRYTALHIAIEMGKPLVIEVLLGYGASVELKGGPEHETPLHIAARCGSISTASHTVGRRSLTSVGQSGTPTQLSADSGVACAEMLIKSGADVNSTKENGETAIHIAARYGSLPMVRLLLSHGGSATATSKSGDSPLHVAVRYCNFESVQALIGFVRERRGRSEVVMLVNAPNGEGETALHLAAELDVRHAHRDFEPLDIVTQLLNHGADIAAQTRLTNETPIHYCARSGNYETLLEMLTQRRSASNLQHALNLQTTNGWSPLLSACERGHFHIVQVLLNTHARVDVFDEHGNAALHLAASNGHSKVCDLLLWHRAFVNAKTKLGLTPLHLAAQNGFNSLLRMLIEQHGAAADALTLAKSTPLHYAAQYGQKQVCSTLLRMGVDATAVDVRGQAPLHLAAENNHSAVVKLFLKHNPELVLIVLFTPS